MTNCPIDLLLKKKRSSDIKVYFFKCSVSDDLYGAALKASGEPLPTPGGGKWLPIAIIDPDNFSNILGYEVETAHLEIEKWGCHWFTSKGPVEIFWGDSGQPTK